jgi:NAD(P)-dependent dehydrogenase (short-subunit alcohol dehydrogenase family)
MSRKALVIGAQGVLGSAISSAFAEAGWEVLRAGRRPESAADFRLLDLDDALALSRACEGADLVVNTAHHRALAPERTILRQGGTLIDLIELSGPERAQLVSEEAEAQGLVVADTGLGGVAYLALADLLREHPEAGGAEYSLMVSAAGSSGHAGARFGHTLLTGSTHHAAAKVPFPAPWGARRCLEVGADGDGVLREAVGETPLRHFLTMQPRPLQGFLSALNGARLISLLPAAMFTAGTGKVPAELSDEPICEWVAVLAEDGRRLAARTIEGKGYYRMTAAATLTFAAALSRPSNGKRGLLSIDELVTLEAVRPALSEHEISVREQALDA